MRRRGILKCILGQRRPGGHRCFAATCHPTPSFGCSAPCDLVVVSSFLRFCFVLFLSLCKIPEYKYSMCFGHTVTGKLCNSDLNGLEYSKERACCVCGGAGLLSREPLVFCFVLFLVFYSHVRPEAMLCAVLQACIYVNTGCHRRESHTQTCTSLFNSPSVHTCQPPF